MTAFIGVLTFIFFMTAFIDVLTFIFFMTFVAFMAAAIAKGADWSIGADLEGAV